MKNILRLALLGVLAAALAIPAGCGILRRERTGVSSGEGEAAQPVKVEREPEAAGTDGAETQGRAPLPILAQAPDAGEDVLRVLFINVGKADAILVQYGGATVLIDTGTEESAPNLLGALGFMGVEGLDGVALTHTHKDHIGGFPYLAAALPVKRVYGAVYSENKKKGGNRITEAAEEAEVPLTRLAVGDALPLGGGVAFEVIGPRVFNAEDDNDNSLILKLICNGRTLLFTGDMQVAEEETLLSAGVELSADVLKVGNHGNPDATGDAFGRAVAPSIAVIPTNTEEDEDSANPRVYAALPGADVRVTQETVLGVLLTIAPDGAMALYNAAPAKAQCSVSLDPPDRDAQTLTIRNNGGELDVSGWMLQSQRGSELFIFPQGSVIPANASAILAAQGGAGDFIFTGEKAPWHKTKADAGILYDAFGQEVARS